MTISSNFAYPVSLLIHTKSTTLIALPSTLLHFAIMKNANKNKQYSITSYHSHKFSQKRKFVYEDDDEQQTLTLKKGFNVECSSSNSNNFELAQSNSYHRHSNKRSRKQGSTDSHVHRKWSYSTNDCSGFRDKFVIASYNILGVQNASKHPHLYLNVPYKYMKWDHRMAAICKELAMYDPSILCFQEVDRFGDLRDALRKVGFEGVLKARTGDARDGCAIFWKYNRFKLLHEENIEFQSFGLRNNVAQFCVLEMNDDRLNSDPKLSRTTSLVVGNTHLLFNPNRGDIKLGQVRLYLEIARRISKDWGQIPVVLAGDFNSLPQSAVYQYISSAKLNVLQHDRRRVSGQIEMTHYNSLSTDEPFRRKPSKYRWNGEELKLATGSEKVSCLLHSLKLRSAYHGVPGNITTRDDVGEPSATLCLSNFVGTVDYIWHNDQLVPVRVLETISRNALQTMGGLPSKNWGSDHLALVCEFAFANSKA